jgi:NAD(P)-dependent dehydrogenase (short-subunit alcohol dehydrogenase family)
MVTEAGADLRTGYPTTAPGPSRTGQVALVTGGSAGLGLAIAEAFAIAGSVVVLASRSAARCELAAARPRAGTGRVYSGADDPQVRQFLDAEVPLGRWAEPEELAGAALMLTDARSGYITGAVLPVDGGWTCH